MRGVVRAAVNGLKAGASLWLAVLALAVATVFTGAPRSSQGAAQRGPRLEVVAPKAVAVGEAIELKLILQGSADVAGYETVVLFDTGVAEFAGLHQRQNDLKKLGRDVGPLAVTGLPQGSAVGLFSCPVADCVARRGPKQSQGGRGTIRLATVNLLPHQTGTLEIRLGATKVVDGAGNPVAVTLVTPSVVVQVGAGGPHYPAPAAPWALTGTSGGALGPVDLTGDGRVTHADAMEVALEWTQVREAGAPCGALAEPSRDVNQDGCIDVADLQAVVAHYDLVDASGGGPPAEGPSAERQASESASVVAASLTLTVDSVGDEGDANIGNQICWTALGSCTLRAAIQEANRHVGPDTILFNIPGEGVPTIQLSKNLPALNDESGPTTIDGYSQPGAAPNSDPQVSNAVIRVQIRGAGASGFNGLPITSAGNLVRGLAFFDLKRSFYIRGSGASDNVLVGNFIGTDASGTYGASSSVVDAHGVHIEQGAKRNRVGGSALAERNVISGNARHGVGLWHEGTDNNVIVNNLVGLTPGGSAQRPNLKHGADFNFGAANNALGGTGAGERNVVSGNAANGVELSHTAATTNNRVIGNYIGTTVDGRSGPAYAANGEYGILLEDRVTNNLISDNVIANNGKGGLAIVGNTTTGTQVSTNRIGVGLDGSALGNRGYGVGIFAAQSRIGPDNLIAYNALGVRVSGEANDGNTITRNAIYANSGLGIDLDPSGVNPNDPGDGDTGPNEQLNFPELSGATPQAVSGSACGDCTIEVFVADSGAGKYGEGQRFVGAATAKANGSFNVPVGGVNPGDYVTATATDANGNTSEFALNLVVSEGSVASPTETPIPTETPVPATETPTVTPTSAPTETPTPMATSSPTATPTSTSSSRIKDATFEDGSLTHPGSGVDSVVGTVTLETASPLKGVYSARIPAASQSYLEENFTPVGDLYVSFYIRFDSLPTSNMRLAYITNSGTTVGNFQLTTGGTLRLRVANSSIGSVSAPLGVGTVYRVGIRQKKGTGGDAILEGYLAEGDATFGAPFAVTTTGTWTTEADRIRIGPTGSNVLDATFDDIKLDAASMP